MRMKLREMFKGMTSSRLGTDIPEIGPGDFVIGDLNMDIKEHQVTIKKLNIAPISPFEQKRKFRRTKAPQNFLNIAPIIPCHRNLE
jgi:hypothetical protein